jgi:hypothetical protein
VIKPDQKKKKRRYSRGLGDLQRSGRSFNKLSARVVKAIYKGYSTFYEASDKSARKKRDGALRDLAKNLGKAAGKALRASSRLPADWGKMMRTGSARRALRRQTRFAARLNRRFGLR